MLNSSVIQSAFSKFTNRYSGTLLENHGSQVAIALTGNPEKIEGNFNSLFNWGATGGELRMESDSFGWFWADRNKLVRGAGNVIENILAQDGFGFERGNMPRFDAELNELIAKWISELPEAKFVERDAQLPEYAVGTVDGMAS